MQQMKYLPLGILFTRFEEFVTHVLSLPNVKCMAIYQILFKVS